MVVPLRWRSSCILPPSFLFLCPLLRRDAVLEKMSRSLDTLKTMGGAIKDETALQMVRYSTFLFACAR